MFCAERTLVVVEFKLNASVLSPQKSTASEDKVRASEIVSLKMYLKLLYTGKPINATKSSINEGTIDISVFIHGSTIVRVN